MSQYDIIVVGNGLAANVFLNSLSESSMSNLKILQIFDETSHPACSTKTTAVVCLSGVKKGISELGDLIFDSYFKTVDFYNTSSSKGVFKGHSYQVCDELQKDEFVRRFGSVDEFHDMAGRKLSKPLLGKKWDNYLISPTPFLEFLRNQVQQKIPLLEVKAGIVTQIGSDFLYIDGEEVSFKKLILCNGAYIKYEFFDLNSDLIGPTKVVPGAYLQADNIDLGDESFVISKKHANLIYRGFEKRLLIGGSTIKKEYGYQCETEEIEQQYQLYSAVFENMGMTLPSYDSFQLQFGLRHKGRQRMPYAGRLRGNVYAMMGLYKNGFTFPFLLADQLVQKMEEDNV